MAADFRRTELTPAERAAMENAIAQAAENAAKLDYLYMMTGVEPMDGEDDGMEGESDE